MSHPEKSPIVFDQFQRYQFIRKVIDAVDAGRSLRILEVGGAYSPLRAMLNGHSLFILDQDRNSPGLDLLASGFSLPFQDQTFDIVACTDVLEHIPSESRSTLIEQLSRVTSSILILGFPQNISEATFADKTFFEYIHARTGEEFLYLKEHLHHGLPDPESIRSSLAPLMNQILEFENSSIHSWLLVQMANFAASANPEFQKSANALNDLFNRYFSDAGQSPHYRKFFVCFKTAVPSNIIDDLNHSLQPQRSSPVDLFANTSLALAETFEKELLEFKSFKQVQLDAANDTIQKLQNQIKLLESQVSSNQNQVYKLQNDILSLEAQAESHIARSDNLQAYLNLFLNHPAYKIYKRFKSGMQLLFPKMQSSLSQDIRYQIFQKTFEPDAHQLQRQRHEWKNWAVKPVLHIVTAVFDPGLEILQETVRSILTQTYGNWIWNIADASTSDAPWNYLKKIAEKDSRFRLLRLFRNDGISGNINRALEQTTGDYIAFLDHDDTLAPNALFEVASAIRKNEGVEFLYSDADMLDFQGMRCRPLFKPDWSPEAMLSFNLLNQLSVFRRSWLERIGYLNPEMDGAQDWDFYFRIVEQTDRIHHIPKILYHWRITHQSTAHSIYNKPYAQAAQIAAVTNHLKRTGIDHPEVFFVPHHPVYQTHPLSRWKSSRDWKVSIIIPSRDQADLLAACLQGIFEGTSHQNFQVILVDTGSTNPSTWKLYERYEQENRFRLIRYEEKFNFGKACNAGAKHAEGDLFLFLNNDTEIIHSDWLSLMIQWFERPGVGIVGPKLLYPNRKIQHAGVIVGFGGLAGHPFITEEENKVSLTGPESWYRNFSAVTGACLLISKEAYSQIEGFDEGFQLNYSDVDLCLKARKAGYRIVYTPQVRLIHHESVTHKGRVPRGDFERASERWKDILQNGDPYFNPNLTYTRACPDYRSGVDDTPAKLHERLMQHLPQKEIIVLPDDVLL